MRIYNFSGWICGSFTDIRFTNTGVGSNNAGHMSRLAKIIWGVLIIGSGLFVGLFIWGLSFMGDPIYPLEIQNDKSRGLKLKTYKFTRYDKKLTVDSLELKPKEKLEIGTSHSCLRIDTTYIDFDAIEIFDDNDNGTLMKRADLVDYLMTKEKVDCSTYLIR
jgi:hypothetical protein